MRDVKREAALVLCVLLMAALVLCAGCKKPEPAGTGAGVAPVTPGKTAEAKPAATFKVAISSRPGQWNLEERVRGYRETFATYYPEIEVIQEIDDETKYSAGAKKASDVISANPDIAGFVGCNAASGPGVATAVRDASKVGDILIVAMDADSKILDEIEAGVIIASVAQRQYYMTYIGVKYLYALNHGYAVRPGETPAEGQVAVPDTIYTGTVEVNKGNAALFRTPSQGAKEELAEKHPDWVDLLKDHKPGEAGPNEEYVMIGISTGVEYWNANKAGLEDVCRELGVKATFTGPQDQDPPAQATQLDQIMARKPAGILIAPGNEDTLKPYIDKAIDEGIPVICVDTDAPSSKRVAYFGTSNYEAGVMGAHIMARALFEKAGLPVREIPDEAAAEGAKPAEG